MRYVLNFGSANAGGTASWTYFRRLDTGAALTPPVLFEAGNGEYNFDVDWTTVPADIAAISFMAVVNGIEQPDLITRTAAEAALVTPGVAGSGQMTLATLREAVRERSDTQNDPHITDAELTRWLNGSLSELYDLLVTRFGEDYYTAQATITADGVRDLYPLPDGVLYGGAPAFYKGLLVEWQFYGGPQGWATLHRMNLADKNRLNLPQYAGAFGRINIRYRLSGSNVLFAPVPAGGQNIRLWYAPRLSPLVNDTDLADGVSGWLDYVIADAARKAVIKQERDPSAMIAEKADLKARIEAAAQNRDPGEPSTVVETETDDFLGFGRPGGW
jgi:hypothetical protein